MHYYHPHFKLKKIEAQRCQITCPNSQSQEELQLGLKLKFIHFESPKSPSRSSAEYRLELRRLHSFSHCLCSRSGRWPFHQGVRLECVCAHAHVCARKVSTQRLPLVAFTHCPVLQSGTSMQRFIIQCGGQKETLTTAKAITLRDVSEANSCFRSFLSGTYVFLCLANILQAVN